MISGGAYADVLNSPPASGAPSWVRMWVALWPECQVIETKAEFRDGRRLPLRHRLIRPRPWAQNLLNPRANVGFLSGGVRATPSQSAARIWVGMLVGVRRAGGSWRG